MHITIRPLPAGARAVSVLFEHAGVAHTRDVNACFDEAGRYDEGATAARVDEVALGVEQKIALGVITSPEETQTLSS